LKDNIVYRTTDGLGSTRYIKNDEWCTEEEAYPDTSCESCGRFVEIDENDPDACKVCGR
tara:strand:+ start:166 stop:342 length:177 start_codon:yes stop_codon:yes gene_type:complete